MNQVRVTLQSYDTHENLFDLWLQSVPRTREEIHLMHPLGRPQGKYLVEWIEHHQILGTQNTGLHSIILVVREVK